MHNIIELLNKKKWFLVSLLVIIILFILDIWTKRIAFQIVENFYEKTGGIYNYFKVTSFFNIVKVINYGVSFGMLNNLKYGQFILSFITFLIVGFLVYLLWKADKKYNYIVYSLIIAGGTGNLYDRIFFGGVFDFLDFHIGKYHWPAFNLADSLVCIGVFMLVFEDLFFKIKNIKN